MTRRTGAARHRIVEVVLYVDDVAAAAAFLERTADVVPRERSPQFTVLEAGRLRIALRPRELLGAGHDGVPLPASAPHAELVLDAADLAAAHAEALAAGARSLVAPVALDYGGAATVEAPGGLRVTYFARLPRRRAGRGRPRGTRGGAGGA